MKQIETFIIIIMVVIVILYAWYIKMLMFSLNIFLLFLKTVNII